MRNATFIAALLLLLSIGASSSTDAQKRVQNVKERPSLFYPDNEKRGFENAGPPSDVVLAPLLKTKEAHEMKNELAGYDREDLRSLFEVVRVDLGPAGEEAYVAHGTRLPMMGADNDWFWIVSVRQGKAKMILFSNGWSLRLREHRTNGYRDVERAYGTAAFTGETLYRFDGSAYHLVWDRTKVNQ